MQELIQQYFEQLNKVRKHKREFKKQNPDTRPNWVRNEISVYNQMEKELQSSIADLEKHIPFENRHYQKKQYEKNIKKMHDQRNSFGYIPEEVSHFKSTEFNIDENFKEQLWSIVWTLLTAKQYEIVCMYFCDDMTQIDIANYLNIKQQAIAKHIQKSLERLRNSELFIFFLRNTLWKSV